MFPVTPLQCCFLNAQKQKKDHCRFDPSDVDICNQDTLIFCMSIWFFLQKSQETFGELVKISDDLFDHLQLSSHKLTRTCDVVGISAFPMDL